MKKLLIYLCTVILSTGYVYGSELVPLKESFEKEGMSVEWNEEYKDIVVRKENFKVILKNGSNTITSDEGEFYIDEAVEIMNNVSYVSEEAANLINNIYLYHNAIIDAMQADEDEKKPLLSIDKDLKEVLVCTWNKYPDTYKEGEEIEIKYGDVWVFTADEIIKWGSENNIEGDKELRLEQLIGLPPQKGYTHFSLLWVNPDDIYRPSPDNEIDDNIADLVFKDNVDNEYRDWFNGNIIYSYYPHKYPWTRLGYTYDWADNGNEYGLSEFIIRNGAKARVEMTYTNEEFYDLIFK